MTPAQVGVPATAVSMPPKKNEQPASEPGLEPASSYVGIIGATVSLCAADDVDGATSHAVMCSHVGMYRCLHDAIVRAEIRLESDQVGKLEKGDVVDVTDSRQITGSSGKIVVRLRVDTIGWVSLKSHLLQKLEAPAPAAPAANDTVSPMSTPSPGAVRSPGAQSRSPRQVPRGLRRRQARSRPPAPPAGAAGPQNEAEIPPTPNGDAASDQRLAAEAEARAAAAEKRAAALGSELRAAQNQADELSASLQQTEILKQKKKLAAAEADHRTSLEELRVRMQQQIDQLKKMAEDQAEADRVEMEAKMDQNPCEEQKSVGPSPPKPALDEAADDVSILAAIEEFVILRFGYKAFYRYQNAEHCAQKVNGESVDGIADDAAMRVENRVGEEGSMEARRGGGSFDLVNTAPQDAAQLEIPEDEEDEEDEKMDSSEGLDMTLSQSEKAVLQLRDRVDDAIGHLDHAFVLQVIFEARQSEHMSAKNPAIHALITYEETFPDSVESAKLRQHHLAKDHLAKDQDEQTDVAKAHIVRLENDVQMLKELCAMGLLADRATLVQVENEHRTAIYQLHTRSSANLSADPAEVNADGQIKTQQVQLDPRINTRAFGKDSDRPAPPPRAVGGLRRRLSIVSPRAGAAARGERSGHCIAR